YFHLENPVDAAIFRTEYRWLAPATRPVILEMRHEYEDLFKQLVAECMADGALRPGDVTVTAYLLLGVPSTFTPWYRRDGPLSEQAMSEVIIAFALEGARGERFDEYVEVGVMSDGV